ncbi:pyridoxamine 5'-phosphate oxidase family protein [Novosphingobium mangrovi (ex Huang et al. 2023)]|uniref:Pyridoxamine 5'-phosphate oxidase family protein n=1 Tax=Novosphingobium mangrovi (ex Huang et al. 2023) TaxID=2976432 RepID=A0ABT2I9R6_9SPHN|nr:pyridoxamine 5'-phosphate oxidase family protein [Novosphingobium mangrovi (ex Huang et al. 2023)]MCT2401564.1 pyridoxamine 5'-phosphate oxidase family protein [Novosphingobium mangrovi (ex Huang et al. 2023)]
MPSVNDALSAARATIDKVELCVAATSGDHGVANVRVVQKLSFDDTWCVAFATDRTSRKTAEIERTGKLTLLFEDDAEGAYAALIGTASVSSDLETKQKYWTGDLDRWFPQGASSENAAIVELKPERIELWNYAKGIAPEPLGLRAAVLERDGDDWRRLA